MTTCRSEKHCKGCGETLPLDDFYTHPQMADGHLNFCKGCVRARVKAHREVNAEYFRAYDKWRSKLPHVRARLRATTRRCRQAGGYHYIHTLAQRARLRGSLVPPTNCPLCGKEGRIVGHHADYTKPLEVEWMCQSCHIKLHIRLREAA